MSDSRHDNPSVDGDDIVPMTASFIRDLEGKSDDTKGKAKVTDNDTSNVRLSLLRLAELHPDHENGNEKEAEEMLEVSEKPALPASEMIASQLNNTFNPLQIIENNINQYQDIIDNNERYVKKSKLPAFEKFKELFDTLHREIDAIEDNIALPEASKYQLKAKAYVKYGDILRNNPLLNDIQLTSFYDFITCGIYKGKESDLYHIIHGSIICLYEAAKINRHNSQVATLLETIKKEQKQSRFNQKHTRVEKEEVRKRMSMYMRKATGNGNESDSSSDSEDNKLASNSADSSEALFKELEVKYRVGEKFSSLTLEREQALKAKVDVEKENEVLRQKLTELELAKTNSDNEKKAAIKKKKTAEEALERSQKANQSKMDDLTREREEALLGSSTLVMERDRNYFLYTKTLEEKKKVEEKLEEKLKELESTSSQDKIQHEQKSIKLENRIKELEQMIVDVKEGYAKQLESLTTAGSNDSDSKSQLTKALLLKGEYEHKNDSLRKQLEEATQKLAKLEAFKIAQQEEHRNLSEQYERLKQKLKEHDASQEQELEEQEPAPPPPTGQFYEAENAAAPIVLTARTRRQTQKKPAAVIGEKETATKVLTAGDVAESQVIIRKLQTENEALKVKNANLIEKVDLLSDTIAKLKGYLGKAFGKVYDIVFETLSTPHAYNAERRIGEAVTQFKDQASQSIYDGSIEVSPLIIQEASPEPEKKISPTSTPRSFQDAARVKAEEVGQAVMKNVHSALNPTIVPTSPPTTNGNTAPSASDMLKRSAVPAKPQPAAPSQKGNQHQPSQGGLFSGMFGGSNATPAKPTSAANGNGRPSQTGLFADTAPVAKPKPNTMDSLKDMLWGGMGKKN